MEEAMAVTLAEGLGQRHKTPSYELVMRAMREFDALPTLRLSPLARSHGNPIHRRVPTRIFPRKISKRWSPTWRP